MRQIEREFYAAWAVDEDKEQRLDNKNKLWFKERVVGWDKDEQMIEQGCGRGDGTKWHATLQMEVDQSVGMRCRTLETLN